MDVPYDGDGQTPTPRSSSEQRPAETVGTVEHWLCGVTGLLVTGVALALSYRALVVLTQPLDVLSSTALVVIVTTGWLLTWFVLELVWEWRSGRLTTAA